MNAFRQLRRHSSMNCDELEVCVYVLLRVHADDDVTVETRSCVICSVFSKMIIFPVLFHYCSNYAKFFIFLDTLKR